MGQLNVRGRMLVLRRREREAGNLTCMLCHVSPANRMRTSGPSKYRTPQHPEATGGHPPVAVVFTSDANGNDTAIS